MSSNQEFNDKEDIVDGVELNEGENELIDDESDINLDDGEESEEQVKSESDDLKRKTRDTGRSLINQERRKRFQAQDEIAKLKNHLVMLENDNLRLKETSSYASDIAMNASEGAAQERLLRARELKAKAIDTGDTKDMIDADEALAFAVNQVSELNRIKSTQSHEDNGYYNNQNYMDQPVTPPHEANRTYAQEWGSKNTWFNRNSADYNEHLAEEVASFTDKLDDHLYATGKQDMIFSPEYFDYLDQNIHQYASSMNIQARNSGNNNMRQRSVVSPVRGGGGGNYNNSSSRTSEVRLSAEEKKWAADLGVKPEDYIRSKRAENIKYRESRGKSLF